MMMMMTKAVYVKLKVVAGVCSTEGSVCVCVCVVTAVCVVRAQASDQ